MSARRCVELTQSSPHAHVHRFSSELPPISSSRAEMRCFEESRASRAAPLSSALVGADAHADAPGRARLLCGRLGPMPSDREAGPEH